MECKLAAITDEFSPDLETALSAMCKAGLDGAELRMVGEKNVVDLTDEELDRAIGMVRGRGLEIVSIASPLLKCALPGGPAVEERFQKDMFAAAYGFEDQARVAARSFEVAKRAGAKIVRVFSYWRTVRPEACFERIAEALAGLADMAAREGLTIGLENEFACNIATGGELARALTAVAHPNLKAVWDPANALVAGDIPYPVGYSGLAAERIGHIHAKDCRIVGGRPVWGPLGQCGNGWRERMEATMAGRARNSRNRDGVDWRGQMVALWRDGYRGWISLETHWEGPGGDKLQGSAICARNLRKLVEEAGEGYPIDRGLRK